MWLLAKETRLRASLTVFTCLEEKYALMAMGKLFNCEGGRERGRRGGVRCRRRKMRRRQWL